MSAHGVDQKFIRKHEDALKRSTDRLNRLVAMVGQPPTEGDRMILLTAIADAARDAHFHATTLERYQQTVLRQFVRTTYA